jgi:hypothetical protein
MWYLGMCIIESEKVQKLGVVSISYQVGGYPEGGYDFELTRKVSSLVKVIPLRFVAIYVCYSETPWQRVADLISHMVSPILRVRLRSIQGEIYFRRSTADQARPASTIVDYIQSFSLLLRHGCRAGSHQECLYKLLALGVPDRAIPISSQGESLLSYHLHWIEERRQIEAAATSTTSTM